MGKVAKYNTLKGISTVLTVGTPMATLIACGEPLLQSGDTAISAVGIFTLLVMILLFKDKIVENFKMPSAFTISVVVFILIELVKSIIIPIQYVAGMTMVACGIDTLFVSPAYKAQELLLGDKAQAFKKVGFMFTNTKTLEELDVK